MPTPNPNRPAPQSSPAPRAALLLPPRARALGTRQSEPPDGQTRNRHLQTTTTLPSPPDAPGSPLLNSEPGPSSTACAKLATAIAMRLYVYVLEARGLPAPRAHRGDDGGGVLFYAKVTVGKQRFRTRAAELGGAAAAAVAWNEEFVFAVGAADGASGDEEEFEVAVARRRRGGSGREVVGTVRLPVPPATTTTAAAAAAPGERRSVPPTWFTLQLPPEGGRRRKGGGGDEAVADCGACTSLLSRA